jgi:hypothetical protein
MNFPETASPEASKPMLLLKDKESAKVILQGDPLIYHTHWTGQKSEVCPGRDKCELCQAGQKNKFRFRLNAYMNENGNYVAKIFEQGWKVYEQLKALNAEYDLNKTVLLITRSGSNLNDTSYTVIPAKNGHVNDALLAQLKKVPLVDLNPYPAKEEEDHGFSQAQSANVGIKPGVMATPSPEFTEEDIPF